MTNAAVLASPNDLETDKDSKKISFWTLSTEEVCSQLQADINQGLKEDEAKIRLETFGPNQLPEQKKISALKLFFNQF